MSLQSPLHGEMNVEGRYPNVFPAGEVAAAGGKTAEYVEAKAFDDVFYMHRVLQFLCVKGTATRQEIDNLLQKHLSTSLTDSQKRDKIGNLLSVSMRKNRKWIKNSGGQGHSAWSLTVEGIQQCRKENHRCKRRCPCER